MPCFGTCSRRAETRFPVPLSTATSRASGSTWGRIQSMRRPSAKLWKVETWVSSRSYNGVLSKLVLWRTFWVLVYAYIMPWRANKSLNNSKTVSCLVTGVLLSHKLNGVKYPGVSALWQPCQMMKMQRQHALFTMLDVALNMAKLSLWPDYCITDGNCCLQIPS